MLVLMATIDRGFLIEPNNIEINEGEYSNNSGLQWKNNICAELDREDRDYTNKCNQKIIATLSSRPTPVIPDPSSTMESNMKTYQQLMYQDICKMPNYSICSSGLENAVGFYKKGYNFGPGRSRMYIEDVHACLKGDSKCELFIGSSGNTAIMDKMATTVSNLMLSKPELPEMPTLLYISKIKKTISTKNPSNKIEIIIGVNVSGFSVSNISTDFDDLSNNEIKNIFNEMLKQTNDTKFNKFKENTMAIIKGYKSNKPVNKTILMEYRNTCKELFNSMKDDVIVNDKLNSKYFKERHPFCNCFAFSILQEKDKDRKLIIEFTPYRVGNNRDKEIKKKFENILYIEKSDETPFYGHYLVSSESTADDTKDVNINGDKAKVYKRMTSSYDIYIFQSVLS